jgi:putative transposase
LYPSRKNPRAPGFDYRDPGPYFVTICIHHRRTLLGHIRDGFMHLNGAGEMVAKAWAELQSRYPDALFDASVVMPNHLHGIVTLAVPDGEALTQADPLDDQPSLSEVVGWFKTMSTNWYLRGVRDHGWARYDGHLWQPSFHDRIVRNDAEMDRLREYIERNPALWNEDRFYEP